MLKRPFQLALVLLAAFTMLGAGAPSTRFDRIGHKLMCTCGCAEILLECNHMGCPDSPGLIAELHNQINAGATDSVIFKSFAARYGPIVLAAPIRGGFDDVAWIVPFAVLILGIAGIVLLIRLFQKRHANLPPPFPELPQTPATEALRNRIRKETNYGE